MASVQGSWLRKIVASELQAERDRLNFDRDELYRIFNPNEESNKLKRLVEEERDSDPNLRNSHKFYEMTREEV